jgi:hypothetical protein
MEPDVTLDNRSTHANGSIDSPPSSCIAQTTTTDVEKQHLGDNFSNLLLHRVSLKALICCEKAAIDARW